MKEKMTYQTKDFYIAACILASGAQLLQLIPLNSKTFSFVFNITDETAENLIQGYWKRDLVLPIRDFVDALHELKTRIYAEK